LAGRFIAAVVTSPLEQGSVTGRPARDLFDLKVQVTALETIADSVMAPPEM
jgi:hypothetical protein